MSRNVTYVIYLIRGWGREGGKTDTTCGSVMSLHKDINVETFFRKDACSFIALLSLTFGNYFL